LLTPNSTTCTDPQTLFATRPDPRKKSVHVEIDQTSLRPDKVADLSETRSDFVGSSLEQVISKLRGVTCHMGSQCSHSITCQVTRLALTPARQASTRFTYPEVWKAELTQMTGYIPRWFTRPQTVTHPAHGRESNSQSVYHKSDALTTTLPISRVVMSSWLRCSASAASSHHSARSKQPDGL